jgi:hypothetical protein
VQHEPALSSTVASFISQHAAKESAGFKRPGGHVGRRTEAIDAEAEWTGARLAATGD